MAELAATSLFYLPDAIGIGSPEDLAPRVHHGNTDRAGRQMYELGVSSTAQRHRGRPQLRMQSSRKDAPPW